MVAEHEVSTLYNWYDAPSSPCLAPKAGRKVPVESHMSKTVAPDPSHNETGHWRPSRSRTRGYKHMYAPYKHSKASNPWGPDIKQGGHLDDIRNLVVRGKVPNYKTKYKGNNTYLADLVKKRDLLLRTCLIIMVIVILSRRRRDRNREYQIAHLTYSEIENFRLFQKYSKRRFADLWR